MKNGNNCCQAVLLAASEVWDRPLSREVLAAAAMFGGGMGSGCTCGALTGMMMATGLREPDLDPTQAREIASRLHDSFKNEFGATCCRVIRKKQGMISQVGNRACIELTGRAAQLLNVEWEAMTGGNPAGNFSSNSNPE